jgi:hypothetical protein
MLRFAAVPVAVFVSLLAGCLDTANSATSGIVVPTLLTVEPSLFLGDVGCGERGLARYVVTLTDVTSGASQLPIPSSSLTGCTTSTSFGTPADLGDAGIRSVQQGHLYTAEIDGYDRADLNQAPGAREVTDSTGVVVPPRWTTTCGVAAPQPDASIADDAEAQSDASSPTSTPVEAQAPSSAANPLLSPTLVLGSTEVFFHGCLPFTSRSALPLADGGNLPSSSPPSTDADASTDEDAAPDGGG